jgi:ABC-type oligopeptide transport system ATPase subunit
LRDVLGEVREIAKTEEIFENPMHSYTKFLLEALSKPAPCEREKKKTPPAGETLRAAPSSPRRRPHTRVLGAAYVFRVEAGHFAAAR